MSNAIQYIIRPETISRRSNIDVRSVNNRVHIVRPNCRFKCVLVTRLLCYAAKRFQLCLIVYRSLTEEEEGNRKHNIYCILCATRVSCNRSLLLMTISPTEYRSSHARVRTRMYITCTFIYMRARARVCKYKRNIYYYRNAACVQRVRRALRSNHRPSRQRDTIH